MIGFQNVWSDTFSQDVQHDCHEFIHAFLDHLLESGLLTPIQVFYQNHCQGILCKQSVSVFHFFKHHTSRSN